LGSLPKALNFGPLVMNLGVLPSREELIHCHCRLGKHYHPLKTSQTTTTSKSLGKPLSSLKTFCIQVANLVLPMIDLGCKIVTNNKKI
jgi:hypothetical protein